MKRWGNLRDFFLSYFVDNYKYDYWHFPHLLSNLINEGDFIDFRPKADYPGSFDSNKIPLLDLTNQKILVTGADGFIGSHLLEKLLDKGCQVRAFVFYNSFNSWGWLWILIPKKSCLK